MGLASEPPRKKEVLFRVTLLDRMTGDSRSIILAGQFTNPEDQWLGFYEVDDQAQISAVGL